MNQEFKDTLIQSLKNDSVSIINSPVYKKVGLHFHNMLLNSKGLLSYLYECLNSKVEKYIKGIRKLKPLPDNIYEFYRWSPST